MPVVSDEVEAKIIKEVGLDEEEAEHFQRLVVSHLVKALTSSFLEDPGTPDYEVHMFEQELREEEQEWGVLLGNASKKVREAIAMYLRHELPEDHPHAMRV